VRGSRGLNTSVTKCGCDCEMNERGKIIYEHLTNMNNIINFDKIDDDGECDFE
jgi:hypothetical protein